MRPDADSLLPFLKRTHLFANLDEPTLALLAHVSHIKSAAKGSIIFNQNDRGEAAYIVRSGVVNIILSMADGRELVINEMREGDCFGELALLTGAPRSASAIAFSAAELVVIPREEFLAELAREPK